MEKGRRLYGIQPIQMLDSVTSIQTSSDVALGAAFSRIGMQVVSGSSGFACELQVSITGTDFRTAATIATSSGDSSGAMVFIADQPIHHVRTDLIRQATTAETNVWISASQ